MIKLKHLSKAEKRILRKYVKEMGANIYKLTEKQKEIYMNSYWFQLLLIAYRQRNVKRVITKAVFNKKFVIEFTLTGIYFIILWHILYSFIK